MFSLHCFCVFPSLLLQLVYTIIPVIYSLIYFCKELRYANNHIYINIGMSLTDYFFSKDPIILYIIFINNSQQDR